MEEHKKLFNEKIKALLGEKKKADAERIRKYTEMYKPTRQSRRIRNLPEIIPPPPKTEPPKRTRISTKIKRHNISTKTEATEATEATYATEATEATHQEPRVRVRKESPSFMTPTKPAEVITKRPRGRPRKPTQELDEQTQKIHAFEHESLKQHSEKIKDSKEFKTPAYDLPSPTPKSPVKDVIRPTSSSKRSLSSHPSFRSAERRLSPSQVKHLEQDLHNV